MSDPNYDHIDSCNVETDINAVDFTAREISTTLTVNENIKKHSFVDLNLFDMFYDEYLEFRHYVSSASKFLKGYDDKDKGFGE